MYNNIRRIFTNILLVCAVGVVPALGASIFEDNYDARSLGVLCPTAMWTCSAPATNVTVSNAFADSGANSVYLNRNGSDASVTTQSFG
jgi:hypothetical protein